MINGRQRTVTYHILHRDGSAEFYVGRSYKGSERDEAVGECRNLREVAKGEFLLIRLTQEVITKIEEVCVD